MQWSFYLFVSQPFTQGKTEKRISLLECFPCRSIYLTLSSCASPLEKDLQEVGEWAMCISGKNILGNGNSICKGPEVGT